MGFFSQGKMRIGNVIQKEKDYGVVGLKQKQDQIASRRKIEDQQRTKIESQSSRNNVKAQEADRKNLNNFQVKPKLQKQQFQSPFMAHSSLYAQHGRRRSRVLDISSRAFGSLFH